MPILEIDETKQSSRASWTVEGGRSYTLQVRIVTDDPAIGARAALLACNVDVGSHYRFPLVSPTEWDFGSTLVGISAEKDGDDGRGYLVTLEFGPYKPLEQSGAENNNTFVVNPLSVPPSVRWSSERVELACTRDRHGKIISNVIGDPFDPPLTRPQAIPVVTITRTLARFDPQWVFDYQDHINQYEWMGCPQGTVLCKELTGDRTFHADWGYMWEQTLVFAFRPILMAEDGTIIQNGWADVVLNTGLREKVGGVVKKIMVDNAPVSAPVALTSKGRYDPDGEQGFLSFDLYPEADFSFFDLPDDLFSVSASGSPAGGV
jgi:hypothetical protein